MALITRDTPPQVVVRRQLVRLAVLLSASSVVFVLALSLAAWWTRDAPVGVPRDPLAVAPAVVDAGVRVEDAGVAIVDAGALVTVAGDVDGGPAHATPPPIEEGVLGARIGAAAQGCLEEALRFDPSLGGKALVTLALGGGEPARATVTGASSPLFVRCVVSRVEAFDLPPTSERLSLRVAVALDGLRGRASVTSTELVTGLSPP